jgi:hypothetical protein
MMRGFDGSEFDAGCAEREFAPRHQLIVRGPIDRASPHHESFLGIQILRRDRIQMCMPGCSLAIFVVIPRDASRLKEYFLQSITMLASGEYHALH